MIKICRFSHLIKQFENPKNAQIFLHQFRQNVKLQVKMCEGKRIKINIYSVFRLQKVETTTLKLCQFNQNVDIATSKWVHEFQNMLI